MLMQGVIEKVRSLQLPLVIDAVSMSVVVINWHLHNRYESYYLYKQSFSCPTIVIHNTMTGTLLRNRFQLR